MFCPQAAEWGNAADWAAAVGSLAAVATALWIAFGQERNARKLRQIAKNEEHERRAHLIVEVIRLTAEIEAFAVAGDRLVALGGGTNGLLSNRDDIEGVRAQLLALQQFPQSDPRIFGEIGRIIRESVVSADFATGSPSYQAIILREIAQKLAQRRKVLTELQSS
ncbi:MAG TPA: hypothetical protein VI168_19275 [Croceibacterium sp.]